MKPIIYVLPQQNISLNVDVQEPQTADGNTSSYDFVLTVDLTDENMQMNDMFRYRYAVKTNDSYEAVLQLDTTKFYSAEGTNSSAVDDGYNDADSLNNNGILDDWVQRGIVELSSDYKDELNGGHDYNDDDHVDMITELASFISQDENFKHLFNGSDDDVVGKRNMYSGYAGIGIVSTMVFGSVLYANAFFTPATIDNFTARVGGFGTLMENAIRNTFKNNQNTVSNVLTTFNSYYIGVYNEMRNIDLVNDDNHDLVRAEDLDRTMNQDLSCYLYNLNTTTFQFPITLTGTLTQLSNLISAEAWAKFMESATPLNADRVDEDYMYTVKLLFVLKPNSNPDTDNSIPEF